MRWLIGILLVGNLVLLLWQGIGGDQPSASQSLPQPDVGNLRLLSERPSGPSAQTSQAAPTVAAAKPPAVVSPPAAPVAATVPPQAVAVAAPLVAARPAAVPPRALPIASVLVAAPSAQTPQPAAPESTVAAQTPSLQPEVTAEPETNTEVAASASAPVPSPAPAPAAQAAPVVDLNPIKPSAACWEAGRFESEPLAAAAGLPYGVERVKVLERDMRQVTGFYVLIPPAADRATAKQTVQQLKLKGVRDTWIFTGGDLRHAISLGLFSKRRNAQGFADSVSAKGFDVQLREKTKSIPVFALLLKSAQGESAQPRMQRRFGDSLKSVACP